MAPQWYVYKDGQQLGPYTREHLVQQVQSGAVNAADLVWIAGIDQWVPAQKIDGLFSSPPPPPPSRSAPAPPPPSSDHPQSGPAAPINRGAPAGGKGRTGLVIAAVIFLALGGFGVYYFLLSGYDPEVAIGGNDHIVVGSKMFTEQEILGHITIIALEHHNIPTVDETLFGKTNELRKAQKEGQIDLYWEYTGAASLVHLGFDEVFGVPEECYHVVKEADLENGLFWLDYTPFNNTFTLIMHEDIADMLDIESISDLAHAINTGVEEPLLQSWVFAIDEVFYSYDHNYNALAAHYGFNFDDFVLSDREEKYDLLKDGKVSATMGFATDPSTQIFNLVRLVDDLHLFPAFNCAPVVRQDILEEVPEIEDILNPIAKALDNETITSLTAEVEMAQTEPYAVAEKWLIEQGFID